jgi:hypothetical protein
MLKKYQPQLFVAAMLLVFDIAYSLLSTCQKVYPAAAQQGGPENHCTAFGGVIPWVIGIAFSPLHIFLETYEHALVAGFTIVLAFSTIGLWWSTYQLWSAGEKQIALAGTAADAAKRSATVAERALTLSDRPWVSMKVDIIEGLKFDDTLGCKTKVKLTLLNIGRSPAIGLGFFIELHPSIEQAVSSHQAMVQSVRGMVGETSFGHTRFPNDPLDREIDLFVTRADIESGIKESESGLVEPYIVACAYYGLPTGGRFRYTSISQAIWLDDETSGFAPTGYYPLEKLSLSSFNAGRTT